MQEGSPRAVYDRPASAFIASFLGNANLIPGVVISREAEVITIRIGSSEAQTRVPMQSGQSFGVGDPVALMARPEDVEIGEGTLEDGWNRGRIRSVLFEGSSALSTLECGGELLQARTDRSYDPAVGSAVAFRLNGGRCMVYPA